MSLTVREMELSEVDLRLDYFYEASDEYLIQLGVDLDKLPPRKDWHKTFETEFALPIQLKPSLHLIWLLDEVPVGMSSADTITYGERANMHLHIFESGNRKSGLGTECVIKSAQIYFDRLNLKRLYCQPNAFNIAPNRTLQKAGFRYVKTSMMIPGSINTYQATTLWVMTKDDMIMRR